MNLDEACGCGVRPIFLLDCLVVAEQVRRLQRCLACVAGQVVAATHTALIGRVNFIHLGLERNDKRVLIINHEVVLRQLLLVTEGRLTLAILMVN